MRRCHTLNVRGHTTQQAAAAHGTKHRIDVLHICLAADLHSHSALPRNDLGMVKGGNDRQAMRLRQPRTLRLGLVKVRAME